MKHLKYFVLLLALYCVPAKAQKTNVPVPDSLGKTLSSVFLNNQDISKTPIFPNAREMEMVDQIEGFGSPIAVVASANNSADEFNQLLVSWQMLLQLAKAKNIGPANAKYLKTYFNKDVVKIANKKEDHYTVYVVFKQPVQNIAIKFDLLWRGNKWLLINVDHDFYTYGVKTYSKSAFRAKGWAQSVKPAGKAPKFSLGASKAQPSWTTQGTSLADPQPFIHKVLQDLADQQPVNQFSNLISAADFKQNYQPDLQKMIDQAAKDIKHKSPSDQKEIREMQRMIKEDPSALYKQYVTNDITHLTEYLNTVKFTIKNVDSISYNIGNFDYEVWSPGKIMMKADVVVKTTAGEEGILFRAAWYHDQWQLISMQSTTYGISRAEQ